MAGVVYECGERGERGLERRCEDCNLFTRKLGPGGPCPECDEAVLVSELLNQQQDQPVPSYTGNLTSSSNENMNGLLRQYFPKGTDLSLHSDEHLALVAAELNARPRKTLGWRTPADVLATLQNRPGTPTGSTPLTLPAASEPIPQCMCDSD